MRRCTKCRETKPLEDFHRDATDKKGRRSYCKPCAIQVATENRRKRSAKRKESA